MKLSVGCNWDPRLPDQLRNVDEVVDLHGMLPRTVVGCGSLGQESNRHR